MSRVLGTAGLTWRFNDMVQHSLSLISSLAMSSLLFNLYSGGRDDEVIMNMAVTDVSIVTRINM